MPLHAPVATDLHAVITYTLIISKLDSLFQEAFLRAVERLYEKESQLMLRFIAESRAMMGMTQQELTDEQEVLRETQHKICE